MNPAPPVTNARPFTSPPRTGGPACPTASAGGAQSVTEGDVVTLDASGSTDPEGEPLVYTWTQTGGPAVVLSDGSGVQPTFTAPNQLALNGEPESTLSDVMASFGLGGVGV